ncbi:hypothetical protein Hanom_Chr14g01298591 [Helianthus anomalus]
MLRISNVPHNIKDIIDVKRIKGIRVKMKMIWSGDSLFLFTYNWICVY